MSGIKSRSFKTLQNLSQVCYGIYEESRDKNADTLMASTYLLLERYWPILSWLFQSSRWRASTLPSLIKDRLWLTESLGGESEAMSKKNLQQRKEYTLRQQTKDAVQWNSSAHEMLSDLKSENIFKNYFKKIKGECSISKFLDAL